MYERKPANWAGFLLCVLILEMKIAGRSAIIAKMGKRFNIYFVLFSVVVDILAIVIGMVVAYKIRAASGNELYYWPFDHYSRFVAKMVPIWLLLLASQGLYSLRSVPRGWSAVSRILIGLLSGWGVMIITLYLWRSPAALAFPRLVIAYGLFFTLFFTLVGRILLGLIRAGLYQVGRGINNVVVIVQSSEDRFVENLKRDKNQGRRIIAVVTADYLAELDRQMEQEKIDEIIVNHPGLEEKRVLEILNWAENHGVEFALVPSLMSVRTTNVETGSLGGTPVMYFKRTPLEGWGRVYKRLLDLILVIPTLIILSPLMLLLFILSQLATGSGIITQERVGQDGKVFVIHKFRSMYIDWPRRFPHIRDWSSEDETKDPRITKVGLLLRKTNLDELAQLWDIFFGTMSIVGPRPEQPKYVEKFAQEVPNYLRRHHVKSGLTGWAQINGLRGNTSIPERVKYDLYYIENWSIWFDIRIILSTIIFVLKELSTS